MNTYILRNAATGQKLRSVVNAARLKHTGPLREDGARDGAK